LTFPTYGGEQFDAALGDYYLRQRFYDTSSGRFGRMDTYEGDRNAPLTLNKYIYANGNPINGTDPTGLATLQEYQIAFAIAAIPVTTATFAPSIIAGARDRNTSDDVVVYTGMGTVIPLTGLFGHAFVEVDGEIYTFPPANICLIRHQEMYICRKSKKNTATNTTATQLITIARRSKHLNLI
jgi:RHS repeat-associated protein